MKSASQPKTIAVRNVDGIPLHTSRGAKHQNNHDKISSEPYLWAVAAHSELKKITMV